MTTEAAGRNLEVSRRKLLAAAGMGSGALVAVSFNVVGDALAASVPDKAPDPAATPTVAGLHLQFGADASSEVTVSWHALQPVRKSRLASRKCRVIVSVGSSPDPVTGKRPPVYVKEDAPWSAVRNAAHAYGFAAFTVDPGSQRSGFTTMKVVYYDVTGPGGHLAEFETFTLRRPRRD